MLKRRKWIVENFRIGLGALAIVGLIGSAALIVNAGMLLFQSQIAQSAADSASLSGALALTQGYSLEQIESIVLERAREQGFDADDPNISIELSWISPTLGATASASNNLQVTLTTSSNSLFSKVFNTNKNRIKVDSIAHARIDEDFAPGYAVVSLNEDLCLAVGSSDNSALDKSGNGCDASAFTSANTHPVPITGGTQITLTEIPLPDCSGLSDFGDVVVQGNATIQPGKYSSISIGRYASLNMNPGLYCIYGKGSEGHSFMIEEYARVVGQQVMIFHLEGSGNFEASRSSSVYLYSADTLLDQSGQEWGGMLIYAHPDNNHEFIFTGTSKTTYQGTIYAPGAHCEAIGSSGLVTLKSQLVCDTVQFSQVSGLYVSYDMASNYHLPETAEIMK